jgi:hypothetical protein
MEENVDRPKFCKIRYAKNDAPGKTKAVKILAQNKLFKSGIYEILDPFENKQCGDVKIKFTNDNSIITYEIENAGLDSDRFEKNFKGEFPTVNVPIKDFESIPDGFFMAVDGNESQFVDIPKRFYLIDVEYILEAKIAANVNKNSSGKKENFYKVPSHLVKRYQGNEKKGKYIRVYP